MIREDDDSYKGPFDRVGSELAESYNVNTDEIKELEKSIDKLKITIAEDTKAGKFNIKKINYLLEFEVFKDKIGEYERRYGIGININYPQVEGMENKEIENKINNILKYIVVREISGKNYYETLQIIRKLKDAVDSGENLDGFLKSDYYDIMNVDNDYKISVINERYLSIFYEGRISYHTGVDWFWALITIDLETGERVYLEDYADINSITNAIRNEKFEDYFGVAGDTFLKKNKYVQSQVFPENFEAKIYKYEEEIKEDRYYSSNTNNFYMDEEYIYVIFGFNSFYAIQGTVILKVKKEDII